MARDNCLCLVCFAFEEEARVFRQKMPIQSGWRIHLTGMGAASARESMKILPALRPQAVLTCGFAGALNPQLRLGDVLYQSDGIPSLEAKLARTEAKPGQFLHVAHVIGKSEEKLALWRNTQADAVDMESQVIRAICRDAGIPSAVLRVISDTSGQDLPLDFNYYLRPNGKPRWLRLGGALLSNSALIPQLLQMRKDCYRAAIRLSEVLEALLEPA